MLIKWCREDIHFINTLRSYFKYHASWILFIIRWIQCHTKIALAATKQFYPDCKVRGANMGPNWVQTAPDEPNVGPMNLATWVRTILSVRPSHLHSIFMNFSAVIIIDKVMFMQKVRGQRSISQKSKQILSQFRRFRTITPAWIHRWIQNHSQSLKLRKRGTSCFSRSIVKFPGHTGWTIDDFALIGRFRKITPVWIPKCLRNDVQSLA